MPVAMRFSRMLIRACIALDQAAVGQTPSAATNPMTPERIDPLRDERD